MAARFMNGRDDNGTIHYKRWFVLGCTVQYVLSVLVASLYLFSELLVYVASPFGC
jgi:hypothetical protein